ncbi:hypothetical protein RO3G_14167 [Lichtheimia corymbifera JMRC:FSU:9682]|uniref:INO80 complex subunit B-like conserved region domain-containing protein n=1 Tax=Lichtheimia corymbifera JMRC:FSU:9682 TaxID=1263082 RepID=A0A068REY1_9FUNG|nr:hypothetical protein RO3G_14167 [Lichtheimia corymbifera JMRC:FSU:9682]
MKRTHDDPESPLSSLDSQEELSEDELEDELDDNIVNPDVDELEEIEDEDDDLDDLSDEETPTPLPASSRKKKSMKRKRPVYQEPNSDEDIEEMNEDQEMEEQQEDEEEEEEEEEDDDEGDDLEVVSNRPLTKRQRAKFNNDGPEEFLELPMDSGKKKNILTEEEQTLRRSEVARRRKNQSIQRAEKDKEDTINRLLKKQASKSRKVIKDDANEEKDSRAPKRVMPPDTIKYVNDAKGSVLMIPSVVAVEQIFGHPPRKSSPAPNTCQVDGCNASKKYVASKSGKAVCSLEHYRVVEAK